MLFKKQKFQNNEFENEAKDRVKICEFRVQDFQIIVRKFGKSQRNDNLSRVSNSEL